MKKLIVPELIPFDMPDKMSQDRFEIEICTMQENFIPRYDFVKNISARMDVFVMGGWRMYAYIGYWYDTAIVKTDDFQFRTYAQWKKAVKDMTAQLIKRWKAWVRGLYREE